MKKMEVVPRIRINGVYLELDQIPKTKAKEIITERIDLALKGMHYERKTA